MQLKWLISIGIFFFGAQASFAGFCENKMGSCSYYECLSQKLNCVRDARIATMAPRLCRAFRKDEPRYTRQGQIVLQKLRICLQRQINKANPRNCAQGEGDFVQAHVDCYVSEGFCDLPFSDKFRIGKYGFSSLFHGDFRRAGLEILRRCGDSPAVFGLDQETE